MKDNERTWVITERKYSIFTWYFRKYKKTISHSETFLPGLDIQDGVSKFSIFFKRVVYNSRCSTFNFSLDSIFKKEDQITGKPIYFTPEA